MAENDDMSEQVGNNELPEQPDTAEQDESSEVVQVEEPGSAEKIENAEMPEQTDTVEKVQQAEANPKKWLVLRVASNKEDTVRETLLKKVTIEGLEEYVGRILVPSERVKRIKAGQKRIQQRKLYPGYVFVEMALESDGSIPEKPWFTIKETVGVGDFIGAVGKPTPMRDHDVEKMLTQAEKPEELPSLNIDFKKGNEVKIREGPFENFEGVVDDISPDKGIVRVIVTIFGRATPLELEYWQLEPA